MRFARQPRHLAGMRREHARAFSTEITASDSAFKPSASTTIGRSTSFTSCRASVPQFQAWLPIPGPSATTVLRFSISRSRSMACIEIEPTLVSGSGSVMISGVYERSP